MVLIFSKPQNPSPFRWISFGQMVPEFDRVCFNEAVGVVHGPVKTQFGYHLVEVTERS